MKGTTVTVRMDEPLNQRLTEVSRLTGRSRSEVIREALRRHLRIAQFEALRNRAMPLAEARGFLTDEDVYDQVS